MKKLLALILCVMLFVSVIPTAAFAAVGTTTANSGAAFFGKTDAKEASKAARKGIEALYGQLAANTGVFNTIKSLDSVVTSMSKSMFEGIDDITINIAGTDVKFTQDDLVDQTKAYLRNAIGYSIYKDMEKRAYSWYDEDTGKIDPAKYMASFAKAASDAIGSEKAQKNLENLMTTLAYFKLADSMSDEYDDLVDAINDWQDGSAILQAYGFNGSVIPSDPYAFINQTWKSADIAKIQNSLAVWASVS